MGWHQLHLMESGSQLKGHEAMQTVTTMSRFAWTLLRKSPRDSNTWENSPHAVERPGSLDLARRSPVAQVQLAQCRAEEVGKQSRNRLGQRQSIADYASQVLWQVRTPSGQLPCFKPRSLKRHQCTCPRRHQHVPPYRLGTSVRGECPLKRTS